jgi:hypothetical protein
MKKSLAIIGFFCLILFVITKVDPILNRIAKRDYTYGNLYDFSKIKHFKMKMPPAILDSSWIASSENEADIILIGDSFSQVSYGHAKLPQLMGEMFQMKVYPLIYKDLYVELPDISSMNLEGKHVVFESTERFIKERFVNPVFYNEAKVEDDLTNSLRMVYGNMFVNADRNYNYFIDHNVLLNDWGVNETWATLRFDLSKITSATTPRFSLEPPMLFYHESVKFFYAPTDQEEITSIVNGVEKLFTDIEKKGGKATLLTIPEKFTVYHQLAGEKRKSTFLENLHAELTHQSVNNITIYDTLINSDQIFYWPTDTHLNVDGYQLILSELKGVL